MNCLPKNVGVDEAEGEEKKTLNKPQRCVIVYI